MSLYRCSSFAVALLALTLAGCQKREAPPATQDPAASAAPPAAPASATPTATETASSPAMTVTPVRVSLPHEGWVEYVQIKHPNARAADVINRELKATADKRVAQGKLSASPEVRMMTTCQGEFPSADVFWERCDDGAFRQGARCPMVLILDSVWSLAGATPAKLDLKAQMTGDWVAVVDASCKDQFGDAFDEWSTFDAMFGMNDGKPQWRPEKNALVLSVPTYGNCDSTRSSECSVPWDRLASFIKPDSPLKPIADKAPPGPKLAAIEDRALPSPPADPRRHANGLSGDLAPVLAACDGGDARACVKVAEALFNGNEVTPDPPLALWMFWKACEAGEPTGCVNLGWSHLNDRQSAEAGKSAAPYFGKACKDKVVIGCLGLGTIYRDGRNTPKSRARAAELFKRACDGGVKAACAMGKAVQ